MLEDSNEFFLDQFSWLPLSKILHYKDTIVYGKFPSVLYVTGERHRVKFGNLEENDSVGACFYSPIKGQSVDVDPSIRVVIPWVGKP